MRLRQTRKLLVDVHEYENDLDKSFHQEEISEIVEDLLKSVTSLIKLGYNAENLKSASYQFDDFLLNKNDKSNLEKKIKAV